MSAVKWLDSSRHAARDFELDGSARRVTGALWLPEQVDAQTPLVLLGHGASGDRYQTPIPYLSRRLVREAGCAAIAIDGPVHGLRQVGAGGREAFGAELAREGFMEDMVTDWVEATAAVSAAEGLSQDNLGYFGLSMGTIFGVPLLASRLEFTVSVLGLCGTRGLGKQIGQRLAEDAQQITHPVLFLMQLEDELFPRDGYLELFDALASDDKRLHANPGLHPEVPAEEMVATFEFLRGRLHGGQSVTSSGPIAE
ncbi:MAG: alpha/beta hydrolase [Pseudomonadota bacterium]